MSALSLTGQAGHPKFLEVGMTLVDASAPGFLAAPSPTRPGEFHELAKPLRRLNHRRRHVDLQRVASALCCR